MSTFARLSTASFVAVAAALAACSHSDAKYAAASDSAAPAVAPNVVTVTARDFAFDAPDSIPAGLTTLHLVNSGKQLHHMQLIKLDSGKTVADFAKAMKSMKPDSPLPSWAHEAGGVNAPRPGGGEASATLTMDPGTYAMICVIPGPDGVPHVMKGMARALTVVPSSAPAATMPVADDTVQLSDYAFSMSSPITAGTHTIRVVNDGPQPHELFIARLAPGKTAADLAVWVLHQQGPPPADPMGGVPAMSVGEDEFVTINFQPGTYGFFCFVPDAKDGKPHAAHGMVKQFTVS
ncbi:MAG TPA: hypothetical protein VFW98_00380 [Gemmatimonadaceae bacterium]|nr:hypothetical protein [Gemmatimonadaceae bacterium]